MTSKVALKVVQYRVADSLDRVRLPSNPRAIIKRENNAGKDHCQLSSSDNNLHFQCASNSTGLGF